MSLTVLVTAVVVSYPIWAVSSVDNYSVCSLGLLGEKQQHILYLGQTFDALFHLYVADVAAIASGREFLVNSSRVLLDTILQLLGDLKPGQCNKLKVYGG